MESTSRIPWLRMTMEAAVIVGSILLAFGIDAWWDRRQEREQRADLVRELAREFTVVSEDLMRGLEGAGRTLDRSRALQAASAQQVPLPTDSLQYLAIAVVGGAFPPPETPRYNAAIASGDIALISGEDLMSALSSYDVARAGYERMYDIAAENFFLGSLRDLQRDIVSLSVLNPAGGQSEPPPRFVPPDLNELVQSPEVYAAIETAHVLRANLWSRLNRLSAASDSVSASLARSLPE